MCETQVGPFLTRNGSLWNVKGIIMPQHIQGKSGASADRTLRLGLKLPSLDKADKLNQLRGDNRLTQQNNPPYQLIKDLP